MTRFSSTAIVLVLASFGCRPTQAPQDGAVLIVLYPPPTDTSAFEQKYTREHMAMVTPANFKGLKQFVAPSAQRVAAHADSISTGGHPIVFIADVRTQ